MGREGENEGEGNSDASPHSLITFVRSFNNFFLFLRSHFARARTFLLGCCPPFLHRTFYRRIFCLLVHSFRLCCFYVFFVRNLLVLLPLLLVDDNADFRSLNTAIHLLASFTRSFSLLYLVLITLISIPFN